MMSSAASPLLVGGKEEALPNIRCYRRTDDLVATEYEVRIELGLEGGSAITNIIHP